MIGLMLLGNGIALLMLGDATYLAVVTAIAAVQLVAVSWLVFAVQARHGALISAGTVVAVASLLASVVFLPAMAIQQERAELGTSLSVVQLVMVILSIAVLVIARLRDRIAEDAVRRERALRKRRTHCETCGQRIHPVLGTCGCMLQVRQDSGRTYGVLTIKSGKGAMTQYALGAMTQIGAGAKCDLRLDVDPLVATNHCVVFERGKDLCIRDAPESGGTYVNGERIAERVLADGDEIRIGDSWLLYERH
jgi:hypothetical protein